MGSIPLRVLQQRRMTWTRYSSWFAKAGNSDRVACRYLSISSLTPLLSHVAEQGLDKVKEDTERTTHDLCRSVQPLAVEPRQVLVCYYCCGLQYPLVGPKELHYRSRPYVALLEHFSLMNQSRVLSVVFCRSAEPLESQS